MAVVVVDRRLWDSVAEAAQDKGLAVGDAVHRLASRLVVGHAMRQKVDYAGVWKGGDPSGDFLFSGRDESANQYRARGREINEMVDGPLRLLRRSAAVYDDRGEARIVEKRLFAMEAEPFVANDLA